MGSRQRTLQTLQSGDVDWGFLPVCRPRSVGPVLVILEIDKAWQLSVARPVVFRLGDPRLESVADDADEDIALVNFGEAGCEGRLRPAAEILDTAECSGRMQRPVGGPVPAPPPPFRTGGLARLSSGRLVLPYAPCSGISFVIRRPSRAVLSLLVAC
jgi:hypothetical protein